ncbi:hypothetical protein B0H10DRAFT_2042924 [Mycena sp. CBHHK59/15]|nr:hypothetical protein B0H10DRAFT_2042924 [Mycena sp. CBHHK59/15]
MPPRKISYRTSMFEESALMSLEAVENAAFEFKAIVNQANIERILEDVIAHERSAVVRLVLSCLDEDLILGLFPIAPEVFADSLAHKILSQLSVFFLFAQKVPLCHENHHQLVKDAPGLLSAIVPKLLADDAETDQTALGLKKARAVSQKNAKMARRFAAQAKNALDSAPFERLNIPVPETRQEVQHALDVVLATQRSILKFYLESFQLPAIIAAVQAACLPTELSPLPEAQLTESENADPESKPQDVGPMVDPPATTQIYSNLPIKFSTLYRRNATGFGDWDINIAPRAEQNMREYNRRDRKTFLAVVKKMRELSNGHFFPDNHKQLNSSDIDVPIYEAKVTDDLRIVYQVDCVPIYGGWIFGVYELTQLGRGSFWDSMGRELGKRGQQYRDRCMFRQYQVQRENHVFVPATFPAPDEVQLTRGGVPDLPSDDVEQPLLDSILQDLDVTFVLEISPKELEIIEHPNSCYVLGRSGTGKTTTMLYKMLLVEASSDLSVAEIPTRKHRQLFVTQSRILADKVREHFAKLLAGYRPSAVLENVKAAKKADRALIADEENDWRSDLPKKYSDLQDEDFPLFLSFDQLCMMIECDMADSSTEVRTKVEPPRVTYEKFRQGYWPHFPQSLSKGLDPSMVFSEFMGVIMGSERTLTAESSFLDRTVYLNLPERGQPTFADQRDRIYKLFESYLSRKRLQGDVDATDRTHAIIRFFRKHGVPGRKMDYLYVDETQDNLLVDTLLLRSICQNPNGLFWAGDTAQTISVGSSFRFNELTSFLFRVEKQRRKKHPELGFQPAVPPRVFQLTVNYRSHSGIVNCAHTIIEVITRFWPDAIDVLERERGTVDGLRPVFFTDWDSENMRSKQLLFGDQSGGYVELGAHQCILVRNNIAKEILRKQVGDIGLIMTLNESKGLEFNDVLIYNFFADSAANESQWRVVLNALEIKNRDTPTAPIFDRTRHASVCVELKFLYVAITRARNNVFIADCSSKGEPMRALWMSKNEVQNCTLGIDTPRFAISSTAQEWEEQGRKLFDTKRYSAAKLCYERAYMPHEAAVASTYYLREEADSMPGTNRRELTAKKAAFLDVASAFQNCARADSGKVAKTYFRRAGECFEHSGNDIQAIGAYRSACEFTRVAELYRKLGKFDEAVDIVQNHRQDIDPDVYDKVIHVARLFYVKEDQLKKASALFASYKDVLEYLEDRGLDVARATLLESNGLFSEAAELRLKEGRIFEAIRLFRNQNSQHSNLRASQCILQGLWEKFPFAAVPNSPDVSRLLDHAAAVNMSLLSESDRYEISMFQAIVNRTVSKLEALGKMFLAANNLAVALLCLDHCFVNPPKLQALPVDAVAKSLEVFQSYVKLLYYFAFNVDPCNTPTAEILFGYRREGEHSFLIPRQTFLHVALQKYQHPAHTRSSGNISILLSGPELRDIFHRSLKERLAGRVREENAVCRRTSAFHPCLNAAVFRQCHRTECPDEHLSAAALNPQQYNLRVRIHLQQIAIYQSLRSIDHDHSQRRYWISRLYATLNPPSYHLGSISVLDLASIPESETGFQVVKEWVRSWAYMLEFVPELEFLTHFLHIANISFQFDRTHAMSYMTRGHFMTSPKKPLKYRRPPDGQYVVAELLCALDGQYDWCLSAGVIFIRHIIKSRLPVHVTVLCDVAEHLCACLTVADRQRRGPIHDITLPLSWLVKCASFAGEGRETRMFWPLAEALSELLEPIYSSRGAEHLLFESEGYRIKDVFLARICRCLCLLAYNFRNQPLRDFVWNSITDLRRRDPSRRFTSLCMKYVYAESWTSLAWAVRASTAGSMLDEMVQLLHADQYQPREFRWVRQIVYKKLEDIPRLLGSSPSISFQNTNDLATERTPTQGDAQEDDDSEIDTGEEPVVDVDERLPDHLLVDLPSVSEPAARSEEEMQAAAKIHKAILGAHRRAAQRKRGEIKSSLAGGSPKSVTMDRVHRLYRVYLLGPLPHLLLCLDIVHTHAQKEAKQLRKDLTSAEHEALELVDKKLTHVNRTLKEVIEIQKALKPTAGIHAGRNLDELKRWTIRAVSLFEELPFGKPPGLQYHFRIAYKGILQPWRAPEHREERKPRLNTEEDMYL